MRINYWALGFGVVALSLLLPWFDPVTTPRFNGLNFPFAQSAYLWPGHFVLFSYGTAAIVVAGLGFAAWWIKKGLGVFCAGALLLLVGMTFFLQVTSWSDRTAGAQPSMSSRGYGRAILWWQILRKPSSCMADGCRITRWTQCWLRA